MDPRRVKDLLADYVPARVLEPAFTFAVAAGYLARFGPAAMRANRRLHDLHRGKRCFVLGNGPSLRTQNLRRLDGEHVFTVNSFVDHADQLGVRPTCHTLMDPYFFAEEGGDGGATLRKVAELPPDTLRLFPIHFKPVVDKVVAQPTYAYFAGDFAGNSNADLSRPLPAMYSVTNLALVAALYMGYSHIYLLGCEMDLLSRVEGVQPLRIRESHYYDDAESVADWTKLGFDYTRYAESVLRMFEGFRFAARACRPGQQILNATPGGMLDIFPRIDFEAIF